jgi:hypothetical protein
MGISIGIVRSKQGRVRIPPKQSLRVVRGDKEGTQSQMRQDSEVWP